METSTVTDYEESAISSDYFFGEILLQYQQQLMAMDYDYRREVLENLALNFKPKKEDGGFIEWQVYVFEATNQLNDLMAFCLRHNIDDPRFLYALCEGDVDILCEVFEGVRLGFFNPLFRTPDAPFYWGGKGLPHPRSPRRKKRFSNALRDRFGFLSCAAFITSNMNLNNLQATDLKTYQ